MDRFVENVPEDPRALLHTAIKNVRQWAVLQMPPHKIGCEGVAAIDERVFKAAEQTLWDHEAKKDPS